MAALTPTALPAGTEVEELAAIPAAVALSGGVPVVPAAAEALSAAAPEAELLIFAPPATPGPRAARAPEGVRKSLWLHLLPVGIVVVGLLTAVVRDAFFHEPKEAPRPAAAPPKRAAKSWRQVSNLPMEGKLETCLPSASWKLAATFLSGSS
jgi:hypothetical protein